MLVLLGHVRGLLLVSMAQVEHPNPLIRAFYLVSGLQHEGLVMFFIVSGFLVGGSVWRLIAQARFDLGAYLINRFARIYLVFIPALLLVLVLNTLGSQFLADGRFYGVRPLLPAMIFAEWWWPQIPCHLAASAGPVVPAVGRQSAILDARLRMGPLSHCTGDLRCIAGADVAAATIAELRGGVDRVCRADLVES